MCNIQLIHAQVGETGDPSILPSSANVELLFDSGFFTEGPAVAPDGTVFFSDITFTSETDMQAGHIWQFNPHSNQINIFRSPSGMSNGIIFDAKGRMVVAEGADFGGRRITRTDMKTGKSEILAGLYKGLPFNSPNDLVIDKAGRIYFTDPRYFGHESIDQACMGVYRIDTTGTVTLIISDIWKPNGIVISPDQQTLYVSYYDDESSASSSIMRNHLKRGRGVLAYDLSSDGSVQYSELLVGVAPKEGVDGMTIDAEGNLYITAGPPNGIYIYSPKGKRIGYIPTTQFATNATFGVGPSAKMLYITAGQGLYHIKLNIAGFHVSN